MIVVKITGGLGNQLFQIAYAIALARKSGKKINLDVSSYKNYSLRNFSLSHFKVMKHCRILSASEINSKIKYLLLSKFYRVYQRLARSLHLTEHYGKHFFLSASKFGYLFNFDPFFYHHEQFNSNVETYYLYGYFQSEKYFHDSINIVRELFELQIEPTPIETKYLDMINGCQLSVAISLRLGNDYFSCKELNVCDNNYYVESLAKLLSLTKSSTVFVFSDEVNNARFLEDYFPKVDFVYIQDMNDYQSLRLMSKCCHFVIPNSSFSWWGAYLSLFNEKIIISPDRWYNHISSEGDIYTSQMIKLGEIL